MKSKKYILPLVMLVIFEAVAVTLWLTKSNAFYFFNFSYIGISLSLSIFLFLNGYRYARRVAQLLIGAYMLIYLGLIDKENMQIEGFWYYLFTGVFQAATIHYAVAKIFGPLIFGRGWCGYACWTAAVLDFLPYTTPRQPDSLPPSQRYTEVSLKASESGTRLFVLQYADLVDVLEPQSLREEVQRTLQAAAKRYESPE